MRDTVDPVTRIDTSTNVIMYVKECRALEGIKIKRECIVNHNFIFADKSLFFMKIEKLNVRS